jgi:hypothetical protein
LIAHRLHALAPGQVADESNAAAGAVRAIKRRPGGNLCRKRSVVSNPRRFVPVRLARTVIHEFGWVVPKNIRRRNTQYAGERRVDEGDLLTFVGDHYAFDQGIDECLTLLDT